MSAHTPGRVADRIFVGRIAGIADIVTFHGKTVAALVSAFEDAVDEYIAMSKKLGRPAQKLYSGKMMLRVPPELHARAAMMAEASGKSLNTWAAAGTVGDEDRVQVKRWFTAVK